MTIEPLPILLASISWLFDPADRTYYLYWIISSLIAVFWALLYWPARRHTLRKLFSHDLWLSRSTLHDVILILLNKAVFFALGITWLIFSISIALHVTDFLEVFGNATDPGTYTNHPWVVGIYSFGLFILEDCSRFLLHWATHKFNFLWRLHQVHHSATSLTPLTVMRIHPIESLLYQIRGALVHGIAAGIAFFYLGFQPDSWQIWGAAAWVITFNALGANLRHSPIPISYGNLEKLFISPAQHQAHHGVTTMNKNFGSVLSIWDRLAGTWRSGKLDYQLPQEEQPLWKQLMMRNIKWK